jgi:BASS family bile acid:Na+ symporter
VARRLGLVWLGRHGSAVIAVGVFLGLAFPPLASLLKPLLIPAIVGPFLIALIRLDWRRLGDYLTRPAPTALALLWLLVLSPLLVHAVVRLLGLPAPIHGGLVLMAAAPPLMASGALALMLGLDAALAVLVTMLASALMPFTLPPIALHLLGVEIDIAVGELMLRLGLVVGGCFATACACAGSCRPASPCATPKRSTASPCSACCCSRPRSWTGSPPWPSSSRASSCSARSRSSG